MKNIDVASFKRDYAIVSICAVLVGFVIGWMAGQDVGERLCHAAIERLIP